MINRFPLYTQNEAMDCGPVCLRMVAKYYGHHYSLQTLRKKCFITREGDSINMTHCPFRVRQWCVNRSRGDHPTSSVRW